MGTTLSGTHLYNVKSEAEGVAFQLGISGAHSVEYEGQTWWKPGETEEMFQDRLYNGNNPGKTFIEFRQSLP